MFPVDRLILVAGVLLVAAIASSKVSSRVGLPVLVLFLIVGMLAGSEGPGGIAFESYGLAHGVGTTALVLILFDGGLRTDLATARLVAAPALVLATVGVLMTAACVAAAAVALLDISWLQAFLLGSIVSSTDAAAVFAVLRSSGVRVPERVSATLELESGSNDPMAVFLTIASLELLQGQLESGVGVAALFVQQLVLGALVGWGVGRGARSAIRHVRLDAAGLYPALTGAAALLSYGVAASVGGSGFLAVYVAGAVLGSGPIVFRKGLLLFHDGVAWLAQIAMFAMLGLLSFPSRLLAVAGPALVVAAVLVLVARPLAVAVCLVPFRFTSREIAFVSWGGLKGAVPIILATYPLLRDLGGAEGLFDVVFFGVVVSAVSQGWTLPFAARRLGLQLPPTPEPPVTLEITSLRDVDGDIVEYTLAEDTPATGRRIRDLSFPDEALVAMVVRGDQLVAPRGSTMLAPGDHVFVLLRPGARWLVDRVFSAQTPAGVVPAEGEFPLRGAARLAELADFYGIGLDGPGATLDEFLRARLGPPRVGQSVSVGGLSLTVREVVDGRIETVGLGLGSEQDADAPAPTDEAAGAGAPDRTGE